VYSECRSATGVGEVYTYVRAPIFRVEVRELLYSHSNGLEGNADAVTRQSEQRLQTRYKAQRPISIDHLASTRRDVLKGHRSGLAGMYFVAEVDAEGRHRLHVLGVWGCRK
jgi:hypothetical protein